MARYRPCVLCGLTASVTDPWTWHRPDGTATTYYDLECPAGHHAYGCTDRGG